MSRRNQMFSLLSMGVLLLTPSIGSAETVSAPVSGPISTPVTSSILDYYYTRAVNQVDRVESYLVWFGVVGIVSLVFLLLASRQYEKARTDATAFPMARLSMSVAQIGLALTVIGYLLMNLAISVMNESKDAFYDIRSRFESGGGGEASGSVVIRQQTDEEVGGGGYASGGRPESQSDQESAEY